MNESAIHGAPSPHSDAELTAAPANLLEPSLGALRPAPADIERWTDRYFIKTKQTIGRFGDKTVCYAVFMRRPVIFTPRLMVRWLEQVMAARQIDVRIDLTVPTYFTKGLDRAYPDKWASSYPSHGTIRIAGS